MRFPFVVADNNQSDRQRFGPRHTTKLLNGASPLMPALFPDPERPRITVESSNAIDYGVFIGIVSCAGAYKLPH